MKNILNLRSFFAFAFIGILFVGCSDDDNPGEIIEPTPELTSGEADFSTYVALGNSLTAGYTDGALFRAGQQSSIPNLLAQKFSLIGGGEFTQPLTNDNVGGLLFNGTPNPDFPPRLYFDLSTQSPTRLTSTPTTEVFNIQPGPYNNLGVPGAKSYHLLSDGYGNPSNLSLGLANPYYVRMASSPNASVLLDAMAQSPTFFTLWIGANDVVGYALSGGESDPNSDDFSPMTDMATFNFAYSTLINTLISGGAKGAVANIPELTDMAHFTTVPYNPLDPSTNADFAGQIPLLNNVFGAINQIYAAVQMPERSITFSATEPSALVIWDEMLVDLSDTIRNALSNSPEFSLFVQSLGLPESEAPKVAALFGATYGQSRQATEDDLFVLTSSSTIGTVNMDRLMFLMSQGIPQQLAGQFSVEGITLPMADKWVLIPSEQAEITARTSEINATIKNISTQAGLAFVDAHAIFTKITNGDYRSGNFVFTPDLVLGGIFSLDGVHLTSRAYALAANEFMMAIDATYGSNFEASGQLYNVGEFPTNFPKDM